MRIVAAIFAGGQGRRVDFNTKPLLPLAGRPLLEHVTQTLRRQGVTEIALCARNNPELQNLGYTTLPDHPGKVGGPLAALVPALHWSQSASTPSLLFTCPADTPFLPNHLLRKLLSVWQQLELDALIVSSHGNLHPTIGLWRRDLGPRLEHHLQQTNNFSIKHWLDQCRFAILDYTKQGEDPFFNINTWQDLQQAEDRAKQSARI